MGKPNVIFTITPAESRKATMESQAGAGDSAYESSDSLRHNAKAKLGLPETKLSESLPSSKHGSRSNLIRSASDTFQQMCDIPIAHLRRLNMKPEIGPYARETQFFTDVTTMHGPLRIYSGQRIGFYFWACVMLASAALLISQIVSVANLYTARPVVSQVSFLIEKSGMLFPVVTFCNFNPIKKSWLDKQKNTSQAIPKSLVDYLLQANVEMQALYANAIKSELVEGQAVYDEYVAKQDARLTVDSFYRDGGFECSELFLQCSFGGRKFNCCQHIVDVLTPLGKCYSLNVKKFGNPWMLRQAMAGEFNGLQVILDSHLEEISYSGAGEESDPVFTNAFENGFRYFVHAEEAVSYVGSEGISVSPNTRSYTSIAATHTQLLDADNWGSCIRDWPKKYSMKVPYSSGNCILECKAQFYLAKCGCMPLMYALEINNPPAERVCTPLEMYVCVDSTKKANGTDFEMPECAECAVECESWQYTAFNSYGVGFSDGAIKWLEEKNLTTRNRVKKNVLAVSVFFKDLTYSEYSQVQGTSLVEMLSNIGGNMGLCFGMSVITCIEIAMYAGKMVWIAISRKRREYLAAKKKKEQEKEQTIEHIASELNVHRFGPGSPLFRALSAASLDRVSDSSQLVV